MIYIQDEPKTEGSRGSGAKSERMTQSHGSGLSMPLL